MMFSGGKAPANIEFFERKNSTMKKLNKKGFTIVELVIVIAVIAILAGVLIPTFATVVDKANKSKAMQEAKNAYELYLADHAEEVSDLDLCIQSGSYYFHVTKGQFSATPVDNHTSSCSMTKKFKVTNGALAAAESSAAAGE